MDLTFVTLSQRFPQFRSCESCGTIVHFLTFQLSRFFSGPDTVADATGECEQAANEQYK